MSHDHDNYNVAFIVACCLVLAFLVSTIVQYRNLKEEHDKLEDQYLDLESSHEQIQIKYDNLLESIGSLDDDISTVYWYFDNENDITFSEAKKSFSKIDKFYDSLFYNR